MPKAKRVKKLSETIVEIKLSEKEMIQADLYDTQVLLNKNTLSPNRSFLLAKQTMLQLRLKQL